MSRHTVEEILARWRELERELEAAPDDERREEIQGTIAQLRDTYQAAVKGLPQPAEAERTSALGGTGRTL